MLTKVTIWKAQGIWKQIKKKIWVTQSQPCATSYFPVLFVAAIDMIYITETPKLQATVCQSWEQRGKLWDSRLARVAVVDNREKQDDFENELIEAFHPLKHEVVASVIAL